MFGPPSRTLTRNEEFSGFLLWDRFVVPMFSVWNSFWGDTTEFEDQTWYRTIPLILLLNNIIVNETAGYEVQKSNFLCKQQALDLAVYSLFFSEKIGLVPRLFLRDNDDEKWDVFIELKWIIQNFFTINWKTNYGE